MDVYTEAGIGWGSGTGDWKFLNVKGIRRPGTSRLMAAGGCQMGSPGGSVTFDGCEFGNTADDLVDYFGGGLFTCERQEAPRTVVTWGGGCGRRHRELLHEHGGSSRTGPPSRGRVADITDPAMQADAHHLVKDVLKARDTRRQAPAPGHAGPGRPRLAGRLRRERHGEPRRITSRSATATSTTAASG